MSLKTSRAGFTPSERKIYKTTLGIRRNKLRYSLTGFTLVEVLVVVAIIATLASIMTISFGEAGSQKRDAERKTDLRQLQSAVENYKRKEGQYPDPGCMTRGWSSESNCDIYIIGLWPEYISELPTDPKLGNSPDNTSGFSYRTNNDRSVYKLMVRGTVESEEVTPAHDLAPCSVASGWCSGCNTSSDIYKFSYAVWGGFADGNSETQVKNRTENIICRITPNI